MKKEEFLAMSLPFGLKMQSNINKKDIVNVYGIELNEGLFHADTDEYSWYCIDMFKPILHPLSDLTKTIEHNGEKFVLFDFIENIGIDSCSLGVNDSGIKIHLDDCDWIYAIDILNNINLTLIEFHFDVDNLIEKNEAIDVNILEINPYK